MKNTLEMKSYKNINNLFGWLAFLIAMIVYVLTVEEVASFWDCGEFIACAEKLQVPHPPGAPLFMILGRLFSLLSPTVDQIAYWVNMLSVVSSAVTILFLHWTVTMIARKIVQKGITDVEPTFVETLAIQFSGLIAALAYTFSDSFWFSAGEAEVYAMSSLFTALIVWVMLKWERAAENPDADRWLLAAAFVIGLSTGVHLLILLTLPALGLIYYFRKYKKIDAKGVVATLGISVFILFFVLIIVIQQIPSLSWGFEKFFVNSLGMGFNSGIYFFLFLLAGGMTYGTYYSYQKNKKLMNLVMLSITFIMLGYMPYGIIMIRSNQNPIIDENNPEAVPQFVSYLKREQYGSSPILTGAQFTVNPIGYKDKKIKKYKKGENGKYVVYKEQVQYKYNKAEISLFPRMHSQRDDHKRAYISFLKKDDPNYIEGTIPTFSQNIKFFFQVQLGQWYWRYFGWNFVGREGQIKGDGVLWGAADNESLPVLSQSKARNSYYAIPLILGLIGLVFHAYKDEKETVIIGLLFFFTGLAVLIYLNTPPNEPRERDYAYVGSYYAFAIWIGLGCLAIWDTLRTRLKTGASLALGVAVLVSSCVPTIMAVQGWDDHDRSGRYFSIDQGKNMLESCAPNAILFTGGDNDTFPLWYLQEVEGFRTDVRICNLSLLNTDWYIDQMKRKAHKSEGLPIQLPKKYYQEGTNDRLYYQDKNGKKEDRMMSVRGYMKAVMNNDHRVMGRGYNALFNSKNWFVSYDSTAMMIEEKARITRGEHPMIPKELTRLVTPTITWKINANSLDKKHLIMLDMISTIMKDGWKRPVYFSTGISPAEYLGLDDYLILEGLSYRLTPVQHGQKEDVVNEPAMYDNLFRKFEFRGLKDSTRSYTSEFPLHVSMQRRHYMRYATAMARQGKFDKVVEAIDFVEENIPDASIPFAEDMTGAPQLLYVAGKHKRAINLLTRLHKRFQRDLDYRLENGKTSGYEFYRELSGLQSLGNSCIGMLQREKEEDKKVLEDALAQIRGDIDRYSSLAKRP